MRLRTVILGLALVLCGSAFGQIEKAEGSVEKWCGKLLKAMKKDSPDKAFSFYLTKDDLTHFKALYEERGNYTEFSVDTVYRYYKNNKMQQLLQTFHRGKDLGIDWKNTKMIDYSVHFTEALDVAEEAYLEVYFESNGKKFQFEIKPAYYVNGKWRIADFLFVEEMHDH